MVFEVPLAKQNVKPHQVTAMHLLAALAFVAVASIMLLVNNMVIELPDAPAPAVQKEQIAVFDTVDMGSSIVLAIGVFILLATLFRNRWLTTPLNNNIFRLVESYLSLGIAIYFLARGWNLPCAIFTLLTITLAFAKFAEKGKLKHKHVIFTQDDIKLPIGLRTSQLKWTEVEQVLLRHGTLTINGINNKLYQWMTASHQIDTNAFEEFCAAQIEEAKKDRKKYDW